MPGVGPVVARFKTVGIDQGIVKGAQLLLQSLGEDFKIEAVGRGLVGHWPQRRLAQWLPHGISMILACGRL